jgi:integrase
VASIYKPWRTDQRTGKRVRCRKYVIAYYDEHGHRRKRPGFTDKTATEELVRRIERDIGRRKAGLPVAEYTRLRAPLHQAIDAYLDELERLGRSLGYRANVRRFLERVSDECRFNSLADLNPERLREWLSGLKRAGRSNRTQNTYRDALVSACNWWVRQGWTAANPFTAVAKVPTHGHHRPRRAYTPGELQALLKAVDGKPRSAAYRVAAYSGLRRKDLQRLQRRDVDLTDPARPLWRLRAEAVKEGRSAVLPMAPECAALLRPTLTDPGGRTDPVFPHMPGMRTLKNDLLAAGLAVRGAKDRIITTDAEGRSLDFHSFRYFFCTVLARTLPLMKVKLLMRHRDIRTTANLYADLGLTDVGDEIWTLQKLFGEAK